MTLILWLVAVICVAIGVAGLIVPALPGPILIFAGLVVAAWAEDFTYVGATTLIVIGLLAAVAYALDFLAGALGARRYGASKQALIGATVGAVIGMFLGLPGLILGPFLGAIVGQLSARTELRQALKAGWGAWIGLLVGTAVKVALAIVMIGIFLGARLFP